MSEHIQISQAQSKLYELVKQVEETRERITLTRQNLPVVCIAPLRGDSEIDPEAVFQLIVDLIQRDEEVLGVPRDEDISRHGETYVLGIARRLFESIGGLPPAEPVPVLAETPGWERKLGRLITEADPNEIILVQTEKMIEPGEIVAKALGKNVSIRVSEE